MTKNDDDYWKETWMKEMNEVDTLSLRKEIAADDDDNVDAVYLKRIKKNEKVK